MQSTSLLDLGDLGSSLAGPDGRAGGSVRTLALNVLLTSVRMSRD